MIKSFVQIRLSISRIRELHKFRIDISAGKVKIHSDFSPLEYENTKSPAESQVQQYAKEAESWKLKVGQVGEKLQNSALGFTSCLALIHKIILNQILQTFYNRVKFL